jgi:diguanylate cyclase (GGDEF)-like protein
MTKNGQMNNSSSYQIEKIADETGLAIVLMDGNLSVQTEANNNSMCAMLYASEEFAPRCAEFCGRAFQMTDEANEAVSYQCYAGLNCTATPVKSGEKQLVAIIGRTFTKAENYRQATERAITGDWNKFPPTRFFENVLLSSSSKAIETAVARVEKEEKKKRREEEKQKTQVSEAIEENIVKEKSQVDEIGKMIEQFHQQTVKTGAVYQKSQETEEIAAWRSFFGSLYELEYKVACASILNFLAGRYLLSSLAWLEYRPQGFEIIAENGGLHGQHYRINLSPDDMRLRQAFENETPLELRERTKDGAETERQKIALFPIAVGGEVRNALVIADKIDDDRVRKNLSKFCQTVASEIEILRLRDEVKRRNWLTNAVEKFNASLKRIDGEDFWMDLIQLSAELMRSERSSLMVFDEKSGDFQVKAVIGVTADNIKAENENLGKRVARIVLDQGKPVVVTDVGKIGLQPAPSDWKYKTQSFICYPFVIGERKIGVLSIADKADGTAYGEFDLELLEAIAPQVAVLIDRAALKNKAGEFEQLSVTDSLTGLLNRRYLEERLAEEIKRSNRYGYPMSFLMIDVDDFGRFNKDFGVLVGDDVLYQAAKAMKGTLRSADIAARYGGEEFCILLPQTTLAEAQAIAERVRQSVENIELSQRRITISVGVSSYSQEISNAKQIIKAADEAMRKAKQSGKNNVQVFEKPAEKNTFS